MKLLLIISSILITSCASTPKEEIHTYICGPEELEKPINQPAK